MKYFSTYLKSFTLIELLIVIAIIGILAVSLIPRIKSIQAQARDTRRLADMRTIQTALEVYYMKHGRYPGNGNYRFSNNAGATANRWSHLENALEMPLPTDPIHYTGLPALGPTGPYSGYAYTYISHTDFCGYQSYILVYKKEKGECDNLVATPLCPGGYTPGHNLGSGVCMLRPNHWAK